MFAGEEDEEDDEDDVEGGTKRAAEDEDDDDDEVKLRSSFSPNTSVRLNVTLLMLLSSLGRGDQEAENGR